MAGRSYETLAVTAGEGGIYSVELARPKARNAISWRCWNELREAYTALAIDSACRVIVLSARGKGFSAGLDVTDPDNLNWNAEDTSRKGYKFMSLLSVMQEAISAVEHCLKPTIAVVQGVCIGAGIDLITACDVRLCTSDVTFSIREVVVGLAADVGTLARLPKIVGNDSIVRELALTGRDFSAEEARSMGLVSRVHKTVEEALGDARAIAERIAALSPVAVVGTKKNLNFARDHTVQDSLDFVKVWNACMIQSDDVGKAMGAALKKDGEPPKFSKL